MTEAPASAPIQPADVKWIVDPRAKRRLRPFRQRFGEAGYQSQKSALQELLCGYFEAQSCVGKQGKTVSPIGSTPTGGKILKVRWLAPGAGERGGLRLAVVAYCERREVVVAGVFQRQQDPSGADFMAAVETYP